MKRRQLFIILILIIGTVFLVVDFNQKDKPVNTEYLKLGGGVFGTTYNIVYLDENGKDYSTDITAALAEVNLSLSTYDPNAILSKINRNEYVKVDEHFKNVYNKSIEISTLTNGAFDITVGPLVRFWGFGFDARNVEEKSVIGKKQIDSLISIIGYEKVKLEDEIIIKQDERIKLDASAIAKGYGVDVVANLLESKGVSNYMVEIGGEIVCSGKSPRNQKWKVGVDKPIEDPAAMNRELQTIIHFNNAAMATSGSYRQFYYKGNKRFSHTINPTTGYPVTHNLLSATVIAESCMSADAIATACMVLGVDESSNLLEGLDGVEGYFIYEDGDSLNTKYTSGFEQFISAE